MPELPEVEVTRLGLLPHLLSQRLTQVEVRQPKLRWPVPSNLHQLQGQTLLNIDRRGKQLILHFEQNSCLIHLGMSGHLRILPPSAIWHKHDHWQWTFNDQALRYQDPRRFGSLLWLDDRAKAKQALLGPEPLSPTFNAEYLLSCAQHHQQSLKVFLMRQDIVVGVGNIYANEALFQSGIHPLLPANCLIINQSEQLTKHIKQTLKEAIGVGGTTLKDFSNTDGKPGYFAQKLLVYNRAGLPCVHCQTMIQKVIIAQRSSFYCPSCQHLPKKAVPKKA